MNKFKITTKMFLMFTLIIITSLIFYFVGSYIKVSSYVKENTNYTAYQSLLHTKSYIENTFTGVMQISNLFLNDTDFRTALSINSSTEDISQQIKYFKQLKNTISSYKNINPTIEDIRVYSNYGYDLPFVQKNGTISPIEEIYNLEWYDKFVKSDYKTSWFSYPDETSNILLAFTILSNERYSDIVAVVTISLKQSTVDELFKNANVTPMGGILLSDSANVVFNTDTSEPSITTEFIDIFYNTKNSEKITDDISVINSKNSNAYITNIANSDFSLFFIFPLESIYAPVYAMRSYLLILLIFILFNACVLIFFIAFKQNIKIKTLLSKMRSIANNQYNHGDEYDELLELSDDIINDHIALTRRIRETELIVLREQINPHFLYNTLDLIIWKAIKCDAQDIRNIAFKLAQFYKLSLGNGQDFVKLSDELDLIYNYISIQNIRFENKIKLITDIDESLLLCRVLKLMLQPIVENAIIHGIFQKNTPEGTISIKIFAVQNVIHIEISDDGIGIKPDEIKRKNKYGTFNLNERIHLTYGVEFGLSLQPIPTGGTLATIILPKSH